MCWESAQSITTKWPLPCFVVFTLYTFVSNQITFQHLRISINHWIRGNLDFPHSFQLCAAESLLTIKTCMHGDMFHSSPVKSVFIQLCKIFSPLYRSGKSGKQTKTICLSASNEWAFICKENPCQIQWHEQREADLFLIWSSCWKDRQRKCWILCI